MMDSINTNLKSITTNFEDATKWWKSFSLAKTSKEVILGSVKTISTKLYEAVSKLPSMATSSSGTSLTDDIKKILEQVKTTVKGGGSGTSYAKTATMQELGCGPTVATNALFGTSYTQNDPRWANKTLIGGGAGVDPFTFARGTIDETNLADDSSGTKGVTPDYFKESAAKVGKEIVDVSTSNMSSVPAGTRMILGSNQHYENATMLGNGLMSVHDPNFEGEYITTVDDKAREIDQSPDLQYAGAVLGGGKGKFGGGNELKINAQTGRLCTTEAYNSLYRAYMGKESPGGAWYPAIEGDPLKSTHSGFGLNQKADFEAKVKSHFDTHPDYPIFLYQTGGKGRTSGHKINAGEGNHATLIGRKLKDGNYEIYNSAGGKTYPVSLSEIFDPTAAGGKEGMKSNEGNSLWIPQIAPSATIDKWQGDGTTSGGKTEEKKDENKKDDTKSGDTTNGSSNTIEKGSLTLGGFADRLSYLSKDFRYLIMVNILELTGVNMVLVLLLQHQTILVKKMILRIKLILVLKMLIHQIICPRKIFGIGLDPKVIMKKLLPVLWVALSKNIILIRI